MESMYTMTRTKMLLTNTTIPQLLLEGHFFPLPKQSSANSLKIGSNKVVSAAEATSAMPILAS